MRLRFVLLVILLAVTNAVAAQVTCPTGVNHCANISVTAPTGGGSIKGYNFYHTTTNGGCVIVTATTCTKVGSTVSPTTSFLDSPLNSNATYYFVITATNSIGEGNPTIQVSGTTGDDLPGVPQTVIIQIK